MEPNDPYLDELMYTAKLEDALREINPDHPVLTDEDVEETMLEESLRELRESSAKASRAKNKMDAILLQINENSRRESNGN